MDMDKEGKETEDAKISDEPPSYSSINAQIGLDMLATLSRVDVRLTEVTTDQGEVIFKLKRELITEGGRNKNIHFDLYDMANQLGISFRPVFSFFNPRMEVFISDQLASQLTIKCLFSCSPTYFIKDPQGTKMTKIRAPNAFSVSNLVLRIKDMQGNQIGTITKKWNGVENEMFADSNVFEIDFPADLEVSQKAAIIGFFVLTNQDASYHREMNS